jgi:hypothetical protein
VIRCRDAVGSWEERRSQHEARFWSLSIRLPRDVIAGHFPRRCPWNRVGLARLEEIAVLT